MEYKVKVKSLSQVRLCEVHEFSRPEYNLAIKKNEIMPFVAT